MSIPVGGIASGWLAWWVNPCSRCGPSASPVGDSCRLRVIHDELREGANDELFGGWMMVLSGLKTLLETGETLTTPGSLM